jgi:endoglucanase
MRPRVLFLSVVLSFVILALFLINSTEILAQTPASIQGLHVVGNKIVNGANEPIRLLGVNRSGGEYMCIQGRGIWDGPADAASVEAIAAWHTNAIRIPLNEDCWLGINGVKPEYSGETYQKAVVDYVNLVNSYGQVAIVELHWNAPGAIPADKQAPMPDADHTPDFWKSMAETFKDNSSVIFDLFNEPYPDSNQNTDAAWTCWRDGGKCQGIDYEVAGFQQLVDTVRATGATNIIMLGGVQYSNALSQWLTYKPNDPTGNLVAAWHSYNFNVCSNVKCWERTLAPVNAEVPLVAGEIGQNDCAHDYIDRLMTWLDGQGVGYLAWTWDAWGADMCGKGPVLILDYDGTPTEYGKGFKERLNIHKLQVTLTPSPTAAPATPSATPAASAELPAKTVNPIAPPDIAGKAVYIPFPVAITVDGKLEDWTSVNKIIVDKGTALSSELAENGALRFAVAADETTIYVAAEMLDKTIITGQHEANFWNEDSMEFYLNLSGDLTATTYNNDVFQFNINPSDIGNTDPSKLTVTGTNFANAKVTGFVFKTRSGWGFEIGIDIADRITPAHGLEIGLQMQGNGASELDRNVKLIWSDADTGDNSWQNPSLFGRGIFFKVGNTEIPMPDSSQQTSPTATPTQSAKLGSVSVNQTGYFNAGVKIGILAAEGEEPVAWSLVDAQGKSVADGMTSAGVKDTTSGDTVRSADFTAVTAPGTYKLVINGIESVPFRIDEDIYATLKKESVAYFYRNRSGIELKAEYAGEQWARPAGHLTDNAVTCFKGTDADGKTWDGCDYTLDGSGGWYDAGDYGKYVVNGGIATWTLLNFYERYPQSFLDGSLSIPENSNGVSDLLDEARWEVEFLLRMQIPEGKPLAGMAFHKLHDRVWSGVPVKLPTEYDNNSDFSKGKTGRYVYEPTTAATLNLAAVAAQSARIWKEIDPAFSERALKAAKAGWEASQANPTLLGGRVPGEGGGDYGDGTVDDEFYWAAAELYATTNEQVYLDFVKQSPYFGNFPGMTGGEASMDWGSVAALGSISLTTAYQGLEQADIEALQGQIVKAADRYLDVMAKEGYQVPITENGYVWGSNSLVLNNAIVMALARDFTGEEKYMAGVIKSMDYIMGRNALNKSFVSGYGANPMSHPHHRFWGDQPSQGFPPPPPGALAGGPNRQIQDPDAEAAKLGDRPTAKRYLDVIGSYSTNEVAINWNAPLVWVTGYLDKSFNKFSK